METVPHGIESDCFTVSVAKNMVAVQRMIGVFGIADRVALSGGYRSGTFIDDQHVPAGLGLESVGISRRGWTERSDRAVQPVAEVCVKVIWTDIDIVNPTVACHIRISGDVRLLQIICIVSDFEAADRTEIKIRRINVIVNPDKGESEPGGIAADQGVASAVGFTVAVVVRPEAAVVVGVNLHRQSELFLIVQTLAGLRGFSGAI